MWAAPPPRRVGLCRGDRGDHEAPARLPWPFTPPRVETWHSCARTARTGLSIHLLSLLEGGRFLEALRHKGRFADLLGRVPVHVIFTQTALLGAASLALEVAW
jgi:hypothetical protein